MKYKFQVAFQSEILLEIEASNYGEAACIALDEAKDRSGELHQNVSPIITGAWITQQRVVDVPLNINTGEPNEIHG